MENNTVVGDDQMELLRLPRELLFEEILNKLPSNEHDGLRLVCREFRRKFQWTGRFHELMIHSVLTKIHFMMIGLRQNKEECTKKTVLKKQEYEDEQFGRVKFWLVDHPCNGQFRYNLYISYSQLIHLPFRSDDPSLMIPLTINRSLTYIKSIKNKTSREYLQKKFVVEITVHKYCEKVLYMRTNGVPDRSKGYLLLLRTIDGEDDIGKSVLTKTT